VREVFVPLGMRLGALIQKMLDGQGSEMLLKLCVFNLVAQLGFLTAHRPIIRRVFGRDVLSSAESALIYEHVMRCFFAGVQATRRALAEGRIAEALALPTADLSAVRLSP